MATYEADVVIVGSGVAGLHIAYQLRRAGLSVLVLEAGPRIRREDALKKYNSAVIKDPSSPYPDVEHAPRPGAPGGYYIQDGPDYFRSKYERIVGGTTWHWQGTCLRQLPEDFEIQSRFGQGTDWPIAYTDLEPWYWEAESSMGVAGHHGVDLASPRHRPDYPLKGLPLSHLNEQVRIAARKLGWDVLPTPQSRNSEPFDDRPVCCGSATCIPICPIGAKYDASFQAAKAEALGVRIVDNAVVYFIEVGDNERITKVKFKRPDRSEGTAAGRIFILAAHAIETPKILLMSRTESHPNGVANSSDMVGRNLMDHPTQLSWALAKDPVFPYRAPMENAGIESLRNGDFRKERGAFRIAIGDDGWTWPGSSPENVAKRLIEEGKYGAELRTAINDHVARQFRFASLIEQLPDPENRIVPAWDQLDAIGIPRPRLTYRLGEYALRGLEAARQAAEKVFRAMGCTEFHHLDYAEGAGHILGTYRMGSKPADSVVDRYQRTHDHPNLFLAGSGTFPSIGTANPTLTIVALALRTADFIEKNYQTL